MWSIKFKDTDGKRRWAKNEEGPLKGKKAKFEKRQQCRQFCRNHTVRNTWVRNT